MQTGNEFRHRASQRGDIIVGIQDSMDKSKFRLPRYSGGVVPKALDQKVRPECELTACIIHGRGIFIYVADPTLSFGSDWNIEIFSRSLQRCWEMAQKNGSPWPRCAKLFSDNTPKDQSFWNIGWQWLFGVCVWVSGSFENEPCRRSKILSLTSFALWWQRLNALIQYPTNIFAWVIRMRMWVRSRVCFSV